MKKQTMLLLMVCVISLAIVLLNIVSGKEVYSSDPNEELSTYIKSNSNLGIEDTILYLTNSFIFYSQKLDIHQSPYQIFNSSLYSGYNDISFSSFNNSLLMVSNKGIYSLVINDTYPVLIIKRETEAYSLPTASNSGKYVAFVSSTPGGEPTQSNASIVVSDLNGHRFLIAGPYLQRPGGPSPVISLDHRPLIWSPDDKYITFEGTDQIDDQTVNDIFLVNTDCITDSKKKCTVHKLQVNDNSVQRATYIGSDGLTKTESWSSPSWSSKSDKIAFMCSTGICVINVNGTHLQRLQIPEQDTISNPIWSPSGKYMAYETTTGLGVYSFESRAVLDFKSTELIRTLYWPVKPIANLSGSTTESPNTAGLSTLKVTALCSSNIAQIRTWQVVNTESHQITFTYKIINSKIGQSFFDIVPPADNTNEPGKVIFYTKSEANPDIIQIFVGNKLQDEAKSISEQCPTATPAH